MSLPANQRKLEIADARAEPADKSAMALIQMAIGIVRNHPGVTSVIMLHAPWHSSTRSSPPRRSPRNASVLDASARRGDRLCRQALAAARDIGNRQGEALALYTLGKIEHDTGHTAAGQRSWRQALAIFEELGAPQAAEVRTRLRRHGGSTTGVCDRPAGSWTGWSRS